jgi:hypothetical protein
MASLGHWFWWPTGMQSSMPSISWPTFGIHVPATKRMVSEHMVRKDVGAKTWNILRLVLVPAWKSQYLSSSSTPRHPVPACRLSYVHVDLVGPLPASSENPVYLLTSIDRTLGWWKSYHTEKWRFVPHWCLPGKLGCRFWRTSHCHEWLGQLFHLCSVNLTWMCLNIQN